MKMLQHKFVDTIPADIEENILYISIPFCTAIHLCVCGCGKEVVTPLSPTAWRLTFDGKTISLYPSIGNWNFDCRSHYFITKSEIEHVRKWKNWEVDQGRHNDVWLKEKYYGKIKDEPKGDPPSKRKFWKRLKKKKK